MAKGTNLTGALFEMGEATAAGMIEGPDPDRLTELLAAYAAGAERRREVALALWSYPESPLFTDLMRALESAEEHGKWKARNF